VGYTGNIYKSIGGAENARTENARLETWHYTARVENAGLENVGPLCRRRKTQDWKTRERQNYLYHGKLNVT